MYVPLGHHPNLTSPIRYPLNPWCHPDYLTPTDSTSKNQYVGIMAQSTMIGLKLGPGLLLNLTNILYHRTKYHKKESGIFEASLLALRAIVNESSNDSVAANTLQQCR